MGGAGSSVGSSQRTAGTASRKLRNTNRRYFYIFISPWIIGFLAFTAIPMVWSLLLSFMKWDLLSPAKWIGLRNYVNAFTGDPLVWQSLKVTFVYSLISVPVNLVLSLAIAILLSQISRGVKIFRTIYYVPVVVSGIAVTVLWMYILNPSGGLMNNILAVFHIKGPGWIWDEHWVMPSLILMSCWSVGGTIVIWLAGLAGIDQQLYEAAMLDRANRWQQFVYVTIPSLAPTVFFNLVTGVIGALQTFNQAYVMTDTSSGSAPAGPHNSMLFFNYYLYKNAFQQFKMGYASALAWILFVIILVLTLLIFRSSASSGFFSADGDQK